MAEPGERDDQIARLQADVAGLRARLRRVEQDADAARTLAGGADRDVGEIASEFRTFRDQNNRVLSAMRADLSDMRQTMDEGFADVRAEMRRGFAVSAAGHQQIVTILSSMTEQGDDGPPR